MAGPSIVDLVTTLPDTLLAKSIEQFTLAKSLHNVALAETILFSVFFSYLY
jgi:hypothetical protein